MAKHVDATSVHLAAHISATDPSLDPDLGVRPGIFWLDISTGEDNAVLKFRNAADTGWKAISGGGSANTVTMDGSPITMDGNTVTMG